MASGTMSVDDFIQHVKHGKWRDIVLPIRQEPDKAKRSVLKKSLISVTMSGVFNERKEALLVSYSGFICIDVDNYTDKSAILKDSHTYAVFDSVSGHGFAVVIKTTQAKHKDHFRWVEKYYFENFGIVVDKAPQNVASLRYVSYDPLVEINHKSKTAGVYTEPKKKVPSMPIVVTGDKASEYVAEAVQRGINIAPGYQDYLNLSFALVDGFGEGGRAYFHSLCGVDPKYNSQHANRQYDIALKRGKSGISVGTFYHMLKTAGINIKSDAKIITIAALGKKSGRTKEAVAAQLTEHHKMTPDAALALVGQVFDRDDINLKNINSSPERLIESMVEWVQSNHHMRKNIITSIVEENGTEIKRERMNTIFLRCRSVFNDNAVTYELFERIVHSEFTTVFNPITEYIEKNSYRKSEGNIKAICCTIDSKTPYGYNFMRKWLLSIIAAYRGNPVRSVLALVGGQYTGKTEFFRRLLPDGLKRYYAESKLDAGKDDDLLMCQKLIVMDDEMGGKSKDDEKRFKELTSKQVFSLRAPYARQNEDFRRLALLCGTANNVDIISDRTGNTRILPIEVISINHAAYNEVDKDELFMELVRCFDAGEEWQLNKEELAALQIVSEGFDKINFEYEVILKYFASPALGDAGFTEYMTATDIKNHIETHGRQVIKNMVAFGTELKKIFGNFKQKTGLGRVYAVIKRTADATQQAQTVMQPAAKIDNPPDPDKNDDLPF